MNYPFWDIPHFGSGWVIGMIAIFHVMISQFAVGGGLYLPLAERKAMRMADKEVGAAWLKQLVSHSKFFLILTGVFGTVSGVGIWFAIGLTHPEATSTLIHNFVFGWAMEWVFFMVELTTIAVYYYTWNRVDPKLHLKVGWVYAVASVCDARHHQRHPHLHAHARATRGSRLPAPATRPASSGTRSSIPRTGRACCCAPASAPRSPASGP